jgi:hypothetical protein
LIAIVGVVLLGGAAVAAYVLFGGKSGTMTSQSTESQPPPTTHERPPPTSSKKMEKPEPIVPAGFVAVGSDTQTIGDKLYANRIGYHKGQDGETAFLLLTPPDGAPFFLAEDKITNAAFAAFRRENRGGETKWKDDGPALPAMNMTLAEAEACAKWMHGELPTPEQLDYAAGLTKQDGRTGPYKPPGNGVGVKVSHPLPMTRAHDDVSPLGIRDLSGNGREWTRATLQVGDETFAILRGWMYTLSSPLTYAMLEEQRRIPQTQRPTVASTYTGFRVAVEVK